MAPHQDGGRCRVTAFAIAMNSAAAAACARITTACSAAAAHCQSFTGASHA